MFKIPLYDNKKLRLAFEYGLVIADVAKQREIILTPEIIIRAEEIIIKEFSSKSATKVACDMEPNILAILEPMLDNKDVTYE